LNFIVVFYEEFQSVEFNNKQNKQM